MEVHLKVHHLAVALGVALCAAAPMAAQAPDQITTTTTDGVSVHGERYFGDLDADAPLVLLFHQGGSNGRGEYAELAPWLNAQGVRAIAWDQRSGGPRFGETNRTVAGLQSSVADTYCDASLDLQAALDYVTSRQLADEVVVWGSSYSASLVFQLAAANPHTVQGVIGFSPAAGGPLVDCRARQWVDDVDVPMLVFRPRSEMDLPASVEQRGILSESGADFHVVEEGVHGSSMLLDSRTGADMTAARQIVSEWLAEVLGRS